MDHAGHHSLHRVHGAAVNDDVAPARSHCPTCGGTLAGNEAHTEAICIKTLQERDKTREATLAYVRRQRDSLHQVASELTTIVLQMDLTR